MTKEKLQLNRKFLVIESPIPFEIYCPEQDDGVKRRQGSWQMTIHDLLTKSHYPLNPIYNLELIYDESLLGLNDKVTWYTTDLNLGESLRGVDGQLVTWNYDERLSITEVFDSLTGRGLSLYQISNLTDFKVFSNKHKNIFINLDSIFYVYDKSKSNSTRYFYKDGKLFTFMYKNSGELSSTQERDVLNIELRNYQENGFTFVFWTLSESSKEPITVLFSSTENSINFLGNIKFYL